MLGAVLTAVLVMATIASLIVAGQMAQSVADERLARLQAVDAHKREAEERTRAVLARKNAEASKQRAEEALEKAKSSFAEARQAEKEATEQRNRADHEAEVAQQNLYYAQMHLAQQAWREHRGLPHLRELLANWLPQGESPDRRGWEWFYLNSLPYQNLRTLTESARRESALYRGVARGQQATRRGHSRRLDPNLGRRSRTNDPDSDGSRSACGRMVGDHGGSRGARTAISWPRAARTERFMSGRRGSGRELRVLRGHKSRSGPWLLAPTVRAWLPGDRMAQSRSGTPAQAG